MKFIKKNFFIGCKKDFKEDIQIIGLPFDGTESFRRGTAKGPDYIRKYSDSIETFSYLHKKDISDLSINDLGNLKFLNQKPENIVKQIEETVDFIIKHKKTPLFIGGEHLITFPVVKRFLKKFNNLIVLYFDAHADFRNDYDGNKLSHAAVAKRIFEMIGNKNLFLFGIRSFEKKEYFDMIKNNIFIDTSFIKYQTVINKIKNKPVYITIDLDVFDPSQMPAVGNPEAGGISFDFFVKKIIKAFLTLKNIVAIDVVEYAPNLDYSGTSGIFAAKIIRELLPVLNKDDKER